EGWSVTHALHGLGLLALVRGDPARAAARFEEMLAFARERADTWSIAIALFFLGLLAWGQGDAGRAAALPPQSLALCWHLEDPLGIATNGERLAWSAWARGQREAAARLLGAAVDARAALGTPLPPPFEAQRERVLAALRATLGESAFAAAWAEGRRL